MTDFVDAQLNHYNNCTKVLQDLSRQIGGVGIQTNFNKTITSNVNNANAGAASTQSPSTAAAGNQAPNVNPSNTNTPSATSNGFNILNTGMQSLSLSNTKRAKVLFDYEATDASELSVFANQIINVEILPMDNDWVLAESGRDSGKVPKAYIQIVE